MQDNNSDELKPKRYQVASKGLTKFYFSRVAGTVLTGRGNNFEMLPECNDKLRLLFRQEGTRMRYAEA